ncbi:MAG: DUF2807 domain-containing protein [Patescibacteria group bacterium]|nr:DUF2807 domain-containing protein [Patescibacteria group bacterium]
MKKTINISIGGLSFQIEEDAYAALEKYLGEVKARFASYPDAAEIVSDMEDRLAEQLSAKLPHGQVAGLATIEELIAIMGRPDQIGEDGKNEAGPADSGAPKAPAPAKRLFRNLDDVILGGVCSGLAAYAGVDTVWVRLVFAITVFFGGFGVVLYLILWIIVPPAQTATEKLQMRGSPVNLKNLEQTVRDRVAELKKKDQGQVKRGLAAPFRVLGTVLRAIGLFFQRLIPFLFKLIGLVIVVLGALALAGLVFVAVSLVTNAGSPYVDFPLREIASGAVYYVALASAFLIAFVPIVFVMMLGTSLVAYRSTFRKMGSFMLLGLWVVAIIVFVNMAVKLAPQVELLTKTSPYFQTATKEYALRDFTGIELGGIDEAVIYPGAAYKVVAEGKQKDLSQTRVYVENQTLKVGREYPFRFCLFCTQNKVKLSVYVPALSRVSGSGASRIQTSGALTGKTLAVELSGVSSLKAELKINQLTGELSGASKLSLTGAADSLQLGLSGASKLEAADVAVRNADLDLSGASEARLGSLDLLKIQASGASTIYYQSAQAMQEHYSGAARSVKQIYPGLAAADQRYQNQAYGFSFEYPTAFQLHLGPDASADNSYYLPMQNHFYQSQAGQVVVTASLPKTTYPANTDFDGAFFSVGAAKNLSQADCLKFDPASQVANIRREQVNGVTFAVADASGAGMSHQAYDKIYHAYNNSTCYELQTGVRTSGYGAADYITERVDINEVFSRLDAVLNTFTFSK